MATIESRQWVCFGDDPPRIEARLSDGSYLLVGWDSDYSHPLVFRASDVNSDFESIPSSSSNIEKEDLWHLIDEAKASTEAHESCWASEYSSDDWNFGP